MLCVGYFVYSDSGTVCNGELKKYPKLALSSGLP